MKLKYAIRVFFAEHSQYFDIVTNRNEISFTMKSQLPIDLYKEGQILLVVEAERQYTSGATATVVVQLPAGKIIKNEDESQGMSFAATNFLVDDLTRKIWSSMMHIKWPFYI